MIDGKLRFVPSRIPFQGRRHNAGVVDQNMQWAATCKELAGEGINRSWIEEFETALFYMGNAVQGPACFLRGAARDEHRGTGFSEGTRSFETDPGISSRDNGYLAAEVHAFQRLRSGGVRSETGVDRLLLRWHSLSSSI